MLRFDPPHTVEIPCNCGNIERCSFERYVSDVRIAYAEVQRLTDTIEQIWRQAREALQAA